MPMRVMPQARAARTMRIRLADVLQRISTAHPLQWLEVPLRPCLCSHAGDRYAELRTSGMPAAPLTESRTERKAGCISSIEQDGVQRLNSAGEKYLLIVFWIFCWDWTIRLWVVAVVVFRLLAVNVVHLYGSVSVRQFNAKPLAYCLAGLRKGGEGEQ